MPILNALRAALAWLGRQGTRALAASIFLGLAVPQFAAYLKPYLGEAVFVLLLFSYLRTDPAAFGRYLRAPVLTIVAALWVMVVVPLLFGLAYALSGIREAWPALYTIMILQMAITPITSSAAFAALMGLDVAFSLVTLIVSNALSPITTVAFSYIFLGTSMFSPIELGTKLFFFFAASGAIAYAIRRVAGQEWIERQKEPIDGLNVIAVFIFAIAAMDGVPRHVMADPLFAIELGIKLFFFFAASGAIAYAIRRVAGQDWIERQKEPIDGLNVIAVFIFAIAAMDGVPRHVMADPLFAVELLALIFVLTCALIGLSVLVFWRAGIDRRLVIGLLAAFRNIGVVMAAVGTSLPDLAWFYFAMVQFPIYLLPAVLRPLARRLSEKR